MCDIPQFTKPTLNKNLDIYVSGVNTKSLTTSEVEVKNDIIVGGNISSSNISPGMSLLGTSTVSVITPVGGSAGGQQCVYNRLTNRAVVSGLIGTNTAFSSVNGFGTNTRITGPVPNPLIGFSPSLNLYSAIDAIGTQVQTSVDAVTWTVQAPSTNVFSSNKLTWIEEFGRFYASSGVNTLSSLNGINYTLQTNGRSQLDYAYGVGIDGVGRLVSVGDISASYTENGVTWFPASTTVASKMSSVCYSTFWKAWFALPRTTPMNVIYFSENGKDWSAFPVQTFAPQNVRAITWIKDLMVFAVSGDNDFLCVSQDGFVWKQVQTSGAALDSYGNTYIESWGSFATFGIRGNMRVTPKMFV